LEEEGKPTGALKKGIETWKPGREEKPLTKQTVIFRQGGKPSWPGKKSNRKTERGRVFDGGKEEFILAKP